MIHINYQNKRVACVVPPYYRLIESKNNRLMPALHYVAEILYRRGHETVFINGDYGDEAVEYSDRYSMLKNSWLFQERYANGHVSYDNVIHILKDFRPDVVFLSAGDPLIPTVETGSAQSCGILAKRIKQEISESIVCVGYGHLLKYATKKDTEFLDTIITGEAADYAVGIVEDNIRGVLTEKWYGSMDDLPILTDKYLFYPTEPADWDYILSSRGCPNGCRFCYQPVLRKGRVDCKSGEKFVKEIEYRIKEHGTEGFYISDMIFSSGEEEDVEKKISLLQSIKQRYPRFHWWAEFHVKGVQSLELIQKLKDCGCVHMKFGVEMGNQDMLDTMNKNITLEEIRRAFEITKQVGVKRTAYVLLGCPGFSDNDYRDMWMFFWDLHADNYVINITVPYVGTLLYCDVKKQLNGKKLYESGEEGGIHVSKKTQEFWGISDETLDKYFSLEGIKDDSKYRKYHRKIVDRHYFMEHKKVVFQDS